ncbi:hypothetical protein K438DRAFT_1836872 [Mycena galopus ATCC 62051]|nr:hypothetical protein K438DRAFT_1836872 [Mycena galopus ATCC 62051]
MRRNSFSPVAFSAFLALFSAPHVLAHTQLHSPMRRPGSEAKLRRQSPVLPSSWRFCGLLDRIGCLSVDCRCIYIAHCACRARGRHRDIAGGAGCGHRRDQTLFPARLENHCLEQNCHARPDERLFQLGLLPHPRRGVLGETARSRACSTAKRSFCSLACFWSSGCGRVSAIQWGPGWRHLARCRVRCRERRRML